MDLTAGMSASALNRAAVHDMSEAARLWRLPLALAWLDIRLRYRGSVLGPFWLTLSMGVMIGSLGAVYSTLFKMDTAAYLPFLALSLTLWGFLSSVVSEGCTCVTSSEDMVRSARMPFAVHAVRSVVRNVIVAAHNLVIVIGTFAVFGTWPGWGGLQAAPAFALWMLDAVAVSVLLGSICARFRDVPPIVTNLMQVAFFISAIIWTPEQVGNALWLQADPFFALIQIVRAPLLNQAVLAPTWISAGVFSALLCGTSWIVFTRARGRLAFWV